MKYLSAILFGLLIAGGTVAQENDKPDMPYDEDKDLIIYEGVVPVDGKSQAELFKNAKKWFDDFYPNANSVIKEKSGKDGKIRGRHKIRIYDKLEDGGKSPTGFISYTIYIFVRNDKYKYRLTEFERHAATPIPIERFYKDPNAKTNSYLKQVDEFVKDLIEDLKQGMHGQKEGESLDEW